MAASWRARLGWAAAMVALVVAVPAAASLVQGVAAGHAARPAAVAQESLRSSDEVPPWFADEVRPLGDVADLRANADWTVVGYVDERAAPEAAAVLAEKLEERNWHLAETGVPGTMTGWKEGGRLSWIAVSCIEVGGATSVVIQVPRVSSGS